MYRMAQVLTMHDLIADLKARCEQVAGLDVEVKPDSISVRPKSPHGFEVLLLLAGREIIVGYGGWHEHFRSEKDAVECFENGLKGVFRLVEYYRGKTAYKWVVQHLEHDRWTEYSTTALIFFPFWRRRRVRILQNAIQLPGGSGR